MTIRQDDGMLQLIQQDFPKYTSLVGQLQELHQKTVMQVTCLEVELLRKTVEMETMENKMAQLQHDYLQMVVKTSSRSTTHVHLITTLEKFSDCELPAIQEESAILSLVEVSNTELKKYLMQSTDMKECTLSSMMKILRNVLTKSSSQELFLLYGYETIEMLSMVAPLVTPGILCIILEIIHILSKSLSAAKLMIRLNYIPILFNVLNNLATLQHVLSQAYQLKTLQSLHQLCTHTKYVTLCKMPSDHVDGFFKQLMMNHPERLIIQLAQKIHEEYNLVNLG